MNKGGSFMKIAICDDDINSAKLFSSKIKSVMTGNDIFIFTCGKDLLQSNHSFDVIFLDIEMQEMNGFEVAKKLMIKWQNCIFSFITSHAELAVDGYDYQPFQYILKTAPQPVIHRKIKETLDEYNRKNKFINVTYKGNYKTVRIADILFIEVIGHYLKIVLPNDEVLWNKPLSEFEKELSGCDLVRCHRSFIVSISKISDMTLKEITICNGTKIPVSRLYKNKILDTYKNFQYGR